jgi:putative endonuclease
MERSERVSGGPSRGAGSDRKRQVTTKGRGDQAEALAREHLQRSGLSCVQTNFRTPGRGGGEIDLIMREPDGTLVFVEVRQRSRVDYGGAAASIGSIKRARIILAARHYLMRLRSLPSCRFDVVLVQGDLADRAQITWLKAAFDAC